MKTVVPIILILVLAFAGSAGALEVNLVSARYHIMVSYRADGLSPAFYDPETGYTGVDAVWEDSYERSSRLVIPSHEVEFVYPGGFGGSTFATAETGGFQVFATSCAGPTGYEWTDDAGITTLVDFSQGDFLSEATWTFRLKRAGTETLIIYFSGDTDYWDPLDDKSMYVSLRKNGTEIYSADLFSTPIVVDGTQDILLAGTQRDVWELYLKVEGSAWDNDCLRCDVSTNLTARRVVPRPPAFILEE